MARVLGPDGAGTVAYWQWAADIAATTVAFGLPSACSRFQAEARGRGDESAAAAARRLAAGLHLSLVAVATIVAAVAAAASSRWSAAAPVIALFACQSLATTRLAVLVGQQRFRAVAAINVTGSLLLAGGVAAAVGTVGANGALWAMAAAQLLPLVLSLSAVAGGPKPAPKAGAARALIAYAFFAWIASLVAALVWTRTEVWFIERSWGHSEVAMFTTGLALASLPSQGAILLTGALAPHFARRAGAADTAAIAATYALATRLVSFVLFPACAILATLTPLLLPQVFGKAFAPASGTAVVLVASAALGFANVGSALLYGTGRSAFIAIAGAVGAALAVTGCALVVPHHGAWGAAWVRLVAQVLMVLTTVVYLARNAIPVPIGALCRTAAAATVAAAAAWGVDTLASSLPVVARATIAAIGGGIAYLAVVRVARPLEASDIDRLSPILRVLPHSAPLFSWAARRR
jgi:O-antigen/teichoic acid export membrane protein